MQGIPAILYLTSFLSEGSFNLCLSITSSVARSDGYIVGNIALCAVVCAVVRCVFWVHVVCVRLFVCGCVNTEQQGEDNDNQSCHIRVLSIITL